MNSLHSQVHGCVCTKRNDVHTHTQHTHTYIHTYRHRQKHRQTQRYRHTHTHTHHTGTIGTHWSSEQQALLPFQFPPAHCAVYQFRPLSPRFQFEFGKTPPFRYTHALARVASSSLAGIALSVCVRAWGECRICGQIMDEDSKTCCVHTHRYKYAYGAQIGMPAFVASTPLHWRHWMTPRKMTSHVKTTVRYVHVCVRVSESGVLRSVWMSSTYTYTVTGTDTETQPHTNSQTHALPILLDTWGWYIDSFIEGRSSESANRLDIPSTCQIERQSCIWDRSNANQTDGITLRIAPGSTIACPVVQEHARKHFERAALHSASSGWQCRLVWTMRTKRCLPPTLCGVCQDFC